MAIAAFSARFVTVLPMLFSRSKLVNSTRRIIATASMAPLVRALSGSEGFAISVVIATRDRASYLELALASLERQVFPRAHWEIIVADDASLDDTPRVLDECEQRGRVSLRCWRSDERQGFARARNAALEMARGTIVVFLDEDQIAAPDLLVQHLRHHLNGPVCVIGDTSRNIHTHLFSSLGGDVEGAPLLPTMAPSDLDASQTWQAHTEENGKAYGAIWNYFANQGRTPPHAWIYFEGGNASAPRASLLSLGGFDQGHSSWNLGEWGLECNDLALRLHRHGVPMRFETSAVALRPACPRRGFNRRERWSQIARFFTLHCDLDRARVEPLLCR